MGFKYFTAAQKEAPGWEPVHNYRSVTEGSAEEHFRMGLVVFQIDVANLFKTKG
jgi:hypothetical protein